MVVDEAVGIPRLLLIGRTRWLTAKWYLGLVLPCHCPVGEVRRGRDGGGGVGPALRAESVGAGWVRVLQRRERVVLAWAADGRGGLKRRNPWRLLGREAMGGVGHAAVGRGRADWIGRALVGGPAWRCEDGGAAVVRATGNRRTALSLSDSAGDGQPRLGAVPHRQVGASGGGGMVMLVCGPLLTEPSTEVLAALVRQRRGHERTAGPTAAVGGRGPSGSGCRAAGGRVAAYQADLEAAGADGPGLGALDLGEEAPVAGGPETGLRGRVFAAHVPRRRAARVYEPRGGGEGVFSVGEHREPGL